jgi:hypothetical protein
MPAPAISPYAILRVAALPYASATSLAPPETTRLIETILDARAAMEQARMTVEEALHAVVPRCEGRLRRDVLALKRDVHNQRATHVAAALADSVRARLEPAAAAALAAWCAAAALAATAFARAEAVFTDEVLTHLRPRVWAATAERSFGSAIALASPDLQLALDQTVGKRAATVASTKIEKSLLGYLVRAAVKTSPFGTFMHAASIETRGDDDAPAPCLARATTVIRARVSRGVLARIYAAATRHARDGALALRPNSTLRSADGRLEASAGTDVVRLGRAWREVRVGRFRFHPRVAAILLSLPPEATWIELIPRFVEAGLDLAQAEALLQRLLERDLVWSPPATDVFDEAPEASLAALVARVGAPATQRALPAVTALVDDARGFADATPRDRAARSERIRRGEREILGLLGAGPSDHLTNVVVEDSWMVGARGAIGKTTVARIARISRFLESQMAFAPEYLKLRRAFVATHGAAGRCHDVLGFLMKEGERLYEWPEVGAQPRVEPAVRARPGMRMGITAQVQLDAADAAALAAGDATVVVNHVHVRVGWLAARFALGDHPDQVQLRERMRRWLIEAHAPREPVDLVLNGHVNDLQAHPRLTARFVAWPGEPILPGREGQLRLEDLVLAHEPASDLLELTDGAGRPVALVYLGSVAPSPTWGAPYALAVLSQPLILMRPPLAPSALAGARPEADVVFTPERTEHGCVVTRATWWMRSQRLAQVWFASTGVRRLLDVAADCREHGIPPVFFARRRLGVSANQLVPDGHATDAARKPLWIDVRNPFCLELLEKIAAGSEWVGFAEMRPGPRGLWATVAGQPHVSELQIEMMIQAPDAEAT